MSRLIREKRGQFVIIAALLIAALTLATTISIHEINIHRQSITYRPVDGFLLGTTSDMSRVLATSLANYTDGILNRNLTEAEASFAASQSMNNWTISMLTAYSDYGIRMEEPLLPMWNCTWNGTTAYSLSAVTYDIDVDSYGFKGWMGRSIRYVQLQIFPESIVNDSSTTSFNFTLKESAINYDATIPVSGLPQNPDLQYFHVGNYTPNQQFIPATNVSLQYYGNGNYNVTFNQLVNQTTLGVRLDLATPTDKVWISANNFYHANDWSTLHLISDRVLQPNYLYTPSKSYFYSPTLNQNHTSEEVSTAPSLPTPKIVTAPLVNITMYLASVPPNAEKYLTMELGFIHDSSYYQIGNTTIVVSGGSSPRLYSASIDANMDLGFGARTIPENSTITLTFTVAFSAQTGSGWIYFDGTTPSQIYLY